MPEQRLWTRLTRRSRGLDVSLATRATGALDCGLCAPCSLSLLLSHHIPTHLFCSLYFKFLLLFNLSHSGFSRLCRTRGHQSIGEKTTSKSLTTPSVSITKDSRVKDLACPNYIN